MEIPSLKYLKDLFIVCIEGIYLKNTVHRLMGRGPQTLPLKGQRVNIFGFVSHKSLLVLLNYTTLPLEPKRKNKKQKQPEAIRKQWERA